MYNRFREAAAIQQGACNPIAISTALVNAIAQCRHEGKGTDEINCDPAVQMIVHQLAHLTGVQYFDQAAYQKSLDACHARKTENGPAISTRPVHAEGGGIAQWDELPMRCPKKGQLYLSGAIPTAFVAPNDLTTPFYIATKVEACA